ncbi:hypothetical protein C0991_006561, partial [Blastosporella zonata]
MAEHDNAGFPLSYCLLSTASAVDQGKRTKALTAWAVCLKAAYDVSPMFVHVDKDMAEISMAQKVWGSAKISLCWWHLRRAVRARLANGKLATSPYNAQRAHAEFDFIDLSFGPVGRTDDADNEGGWHTKAQFAEAPTAANQTSTELLAPSTSSPTCTASPAVLSDTVNTPHIRIPARPIRHINLRAMLKDDNGSKQVSIRLAPPRKPSSTSENQNPKGSHDESDEDKKNTRHTFCPNDYRQHVIQMMEKHYCAHPLLPGYSAPRAEGIKKWAVQNIYNFCVGHDLPHLWAYLWENWYRKGRWELWARSASEMIPVLKTTMILESHWRRIKHDFLHHFHMPRCDLLAWILVVKLAPSYYQKLNRLLTETGRYRELPSWRKGFKREWKKLARTPISMPLNDAYRPDPKKMEDG